MRKHLSERPPAMSGTLGRPRRHPESPATEAWLPHFAIGVFGGRRAQRSAGFCEKSRPKKQNPYPWHPAHLRNRRPSGKRQQGKGLWRRKHTGSNSARATTHEGSSLPARAPRTTSSAAPREVMTFRMWQQPGRQHPTWVNARGHQRTPPPPGLEPKWLRTNKI